MGWFPSTLCAMAIILALISTKNYAGICLNPPNRYIPRILNAEELVQSYVAAQKLRCKNLNNQSIECRQPDNTFEAGEFPALERGSTPLIDRLLGMSTVVVVQGVKYDPTAPRNTINICGQPMKFVSDRIWGD
jgi:hypothetical protein